MERMNPLLKEIRRNPLLRLRILVPMVFAAAKPRPEAHTLRFVSGWVAVFGQPRGAGHAARVRQEDAG
jgi:hypothetical protein